MQYGDWVLVDLLSKFMVIYDFVGFDCFLQGINYIWVVGVVFVIVNVFE